MGAEHRAIEVVDRIIRLAREEEQYITPMKAQKLTFFCHAWSLGLGNGPIFRDAVESWQHGPVIRDVYHCLKVYGGNIITAPLMPDDHQPGFSPEDESIMHAVWCQYGRLSAIQLSNMTHVEGSPWSQTYQRDRRSQIIHNHIIRDYYARLVEQNRSS